jgi:hypothetical protein
MYFYGTDIYKHLWEERGKESNGYLNLKLGISKRRLL